MNQRRLQHLLRRIHFSIASRVNWTVYEHRHHAECIVASKLDKSSADRCCASQWMTGARSVITVFPSVGDISGRVIDANGQMTRDSYLGPVPRFPAGRTGVVPIRATHATNTHGLTANTAARSHVRLTTGPPGLRHPEQLLQTAPIQKIRSGGSGS